MDDTKTLYEVVIVPGKKRPAFRLINKEHPTLYTSATALCKARFNRDGKTNEWAGPRHVYVRRNGVWISLKGKIGVLDS
jgi:hypothetical protein